MKLSVRILSIVVVVALFFNLLQAQKSKSYDSLALSIIKTGLGTGQAYDMLRDFCAIGHRLSGSPNSVRAIEWCKAKMEELKFDSVFLQKVMVPHWVRGEENAYVLGSTIQSTLANQQNIPLKIASLGGSIATPPEGITAEVLEVHSFEELQAKKDSALGKIIFFNRPMDKSMIGTFAAYGGAVNQRGSGAVEAAKVGGVAALVRSMTTRLDNVPHTGSMHYQDSIPQVPGAAISTQGANYLSEMLTRQPHIQVFIKYMCETRPDTESANVIGELRGSKYPNEVVVVGGHLDSWDKGQGAHDDATGCIQAIEAVRLLKEMGLKPKRTIRAVMFMNEENGMRGGLGYAAQESAKVKHVAAIESDEGGFMPRGFGISIDSVRFLKVKKWESLFTSIQADRITQGGGGVDISPLGWQGVPTIGLQVDDQRYFDYHHSANDVFDAVNERELELGASMLAILAYVIAEEGL